MILLPTSATLMISAAVASSLFVLRILPIGFASVSPASPRTSGMTATPVSKPESPSASFGNRSRTKTTIIAGLPCEPATVAVQDENNSGCRTRC